MPYPMPDSKYCVPAMRLVMMRDIAADTLAKYVSDMVARTPVIANNYIEVLAYNPVLVHLVIAA